jgi:hypothetical protein
MVEAKRRIHPTFPYPTLNGAVASDGAIRSTFERMTELILAERKRAANASDPSWPQDAGWRYDKLLETRQTFEDARNPYPVIFVSFTDPHWRDVAISIAKQRKNATIVTDSSIEGVCAPGFKEEFERRQKEVLGNANRDIPSRILYRATRSDAFLGIWTAQFTGRERKTKDRASRPREPASGAFPGSWMPFEYGVAFAHQNRQINSYAKQNCIRILWDKKIHQGFTDRLFMANLMDGFDPKKEFRSRAQIAQAIGELCEEVQHKDGRR